MAFRLGMNAKIRYSTTWGGTYAAMDNVRDVTLTLESGEADVTTRANAGWRAIVATLREASVEFEMVWDTADAGFSAIKTAYMTNGVIYLQILDGTPSTETPAQGLQAAFMITNFSRKEALEEAIVVSVTAKVAYDSNAPQWVTLQS